MEEKIETRIHQVIKELGSVKKENWQLRKMVGRKTRKNRIIGTRDKGKQSTHQRRNR